MLTDAQIRKAKAAKKPYRLTDGGGLHLYVTPPGGKLWLKGAKIQFRHGSGANPELSVRIAQTRLQVPELQQQNCSREHRSSVTQQRRRLRVVEKAQTRKRTTSIPTGAS
jgi:Arm DNA-binding domain